MKIKLVTAKKEMSYLYSFNISDAKEQGFALTFFFTDIWIKFKSHKPRVNTYLARVEYLHN